MFFLLAFFQFLLFYVAELYPNHFIGKENLDFGKKKMG